MIKYSANGNEFEVKMWRFPDTSIGTNICNKDEPCVNTEHVTVEVRFGGEYNINDTLFAMENVVDALRIKYPLAHVHLRIPYVPYSRQDRVCNSGEGHSLRVMARKINALDFRTVVTLDPHSTVLDALIERCYTLSQIDVFRSVKTSEEWSETYIVAPDQGASKKCEDFARHVGAAGVIICNKKRDLATGKIIGFKILDNDLLPGSDFFVLDDICDKGGTFLAVANELISKHAGKIELAVTHGLFTHEKGVEPLVEMYDEVYTTNSYENGCQHDHLTVIDIATVERVQ